MSVFCGCDSVLITCYLPKSGNRICSANIWRGCSLFCSGMGASQSEQRLEDAFSDEETSGYGGGSPTRQSYRTGQSFSAHGSPGGDLSDEDLCPNGPLGGPNGYILGGGPPSGGPPPAGFEPLGVPGGHLEFTIPPQQQQPCARSRSGSCTSRRSQFR